MAESESALRVGAQGCASIIGGIAGLWLLLTLFNCGGESPSLTPQERIQMEEAQAAEAAATAKFAREQASLWSQPASSLTKEGLIKEVSKCQSAIEAKRSAAAYAILFDDYDADEQLKYLHEGLTTVRIAAQQRVELMNKVKVSSYICSFQGAGFKDFWEQPDAAYMDNYLPT